MTTVSLAPSPKQRFVDSNGNALAGGQLYSYAAGTSTPQATYTDSTGGTANANPVVLDARGECSLWLDTTLAYKFVLKDAAGNLIWTQDNCPGALAVTAAGDPSFADNSVLPASTGWVRGAMSAIATAAGFAVSLGLAGYVKFPSWLGAWIIEWGSSTGTTDSFGVLTVTLPLAFPTAAYLAVPSNGDGVTAAAALVTLQSVSTTAAVFKVFGSGGAVWAGAAVRVNWISIGH